MRQQIHRSILTAALAGVMAVSVFAQRTALTPLEKGPPDPDVKIGREASQQVEKELPILKDAEAEAYVDALGKRLASKAFGEKFPYQFKIVNDKEINAFALPGGFIYVNRGIFEHAKNESQLAGVIGHEIGHVAMRHGMNQMKKAQRTGILAGILGVGAGAVLGEAAGNIVQTGVGFTASSILLKYSRDAESQSDLIGTQLLYDNGYDPVGMVDFFEILEKETKGGSTPQFFSNHPNPDNRIVKVKSEIVKLRGAPPDAHLDSPEFQRIKDIVSKAPAPPPPPARVARPDRPSSRFVQRDFRDMTLQHPDNWRLIENGNTVTLSPERGIVSDSLAYGLMIDVFNPRPGRNGQYTVEDATNQLLTELRQSNPKLRVSKNAVAARVGNQKGLSVILANDSPAGGQETDGLVTALRPGGILYFFIAVAPQNEFSQYQGAFNSVIGSVRFR